jgi:hypothetical protein
MENFNLTLTSSETLCDNNPGVSQRMSVYTIIRTALKIFIMALN